MKAINLARRPFENLRPLRRLTAALWVLGGLFLLINLWLYWDHLTGSSTTRGQLAEIRAEIAREADAFDRLEQEIAAREIEEQNEIVVLLNRLIALRTFPWSLLFERLEQVLPANVRLDSVQPEGQALDFRRRGSRDGGRRRGRAARVSTRESEDESGSVVGLELTGTARDDAALNRLIDAMFEDPTFQNPTLRNERRNDRGEIDLSLSVQFLVDHAEELARREMGEIAEPGLPPPSTIGGTDAEPATRDVIAPITTAPRARPGDGESLPPRSAVARRGDDRRTAGGSPRVALPAPATAPQAAPPTAPRTAPPTTRVVPPSTRTAVPPPRAVAGEDEGARAAASASETARLRSGGASR